MLLSEILNNLKRDKKFDFQKFTQDCAPYLEHMGSDKDKLFLYHGDHGAPKEWDIRKFKPREAPRNSPRVLHDRMNKFFEEKFGYPFRNALFATGVRNEARIYGPIMAIFPIGKFEWLCNSDADFRDMTGTYTWYLESVKHSAKQLSFDECKELTIEHVLHLAEKSKSWLHDVDLPHCIKTENEIMIRCDSYYGFNITNGFVFDDVVEPGLKNI